jgi:NADPH:quinone reductase-like Zn-dependent oxidoreductase
MRCHNYANIRCSFADPDIIILVIQYLCFSACVLMSMKAAQFNKYGGPEVIEISDNVSQPALREGQVLVESYAASINSIDLFVRAGYLQKMIPLTLPTTIAGDFSGVVKLVGPGVTDLRAGDQVYGMAPVIAGCSGAAAEFVAANAAMTARKPAKASFPEAAALPLAGVSAVQAFDNEIKPKNGQKVLIHGGAGGIGSFAIQYGRHLGCYVATTVRASQREFAKNLGADTTIDFEREAFENVLKDYDAVLDTVGGEVYKRSFQVLKKGGIVVSMVQNSPNQELMSKYSVRSTYLSTQVNSASLTHLSQLVDKDVIKPQIDKEFPLDKTREAYTYFEQDHPKGKVVIKIK